MATDYRIIDSDGHVLELDEELLGYLPPPYGDMWWHHSYSLWPGWDGYIRGLRPAGGLVRQGRGPNAQDWTNFLDTNGIERTVLYPTQGPDPRRLPRRRLR